MRIDGNWFVCDDGTVRPVIRADVQAEDASWQHVPFLVDTGADCTALSAGTLRALRLTPAAGQARLSGVGGEAGFVVVSTQLRFTQEDGTTVVFRGQFRAAHDVETLDMSVLGRDLTNLFAVIVDRPRDVVCLLGQRHTYKIIVS